MARILEALVKSPEVKAEMMRIIENSSGWVLLKAANKDAEFLLEIVVEHFVEDLPEDLACEPSGGGGGGSL